MAVGRRNYYFIACRFVCGIFATVLASIHRALMLIGVLGVPKYMTIARRDACKTLRAVWCARLVRKVVSVLVRSPIRNDMLRLVRNNVSIPPRTGAIIAVHHTPWKRLLLQWCLENDVGLIVANSELNQQVRRIHRRAIGYTELRALLRYLREGGRIIVTIDEFNDRNDCPVVFLGESRNLSLFPVRLAKIAGVPIIPATIAFRDGAFCLDGWESQTLQSKLPKIMEALLLQLEDKIRADPCISPLFVV